MSNITSDILNDEIEDVEVKETSSFPFPVVLEGETDTREITVYKEPEEGEDIEGKADYELARDNYQEMMRLGMMGLDGISRVSQGTETPEHFEALAKVLKEVAKVNKEMVELHVIKREILSSKPSQSKQKADSGSAINVDKAVFVGTPADLLKRLEEEEEEGEDGS
jgi:hypothetical protein